jgi:hypothetical protein
MPAMHIIRPLVLGLFLVALTAGAARAGSTEYTQYDSTGIGPLGPIHGDVRFGTDSSAFQAIYPARGALGVTYACAGSYTELDLFVISFWSFQGGDNQGGGGGASGSGIRVLFGLLVFGSLQDSNGGAYAISGLFDAIVDILPRDEAPTRLSCDPVATERPALFERRALAIR